MPSSPTNHPAAADNSLRRETVYAQLREEILHCTLPPGSEIRETSLAARLGCSKTPIRDALMRLVAERLVISVARQGYSVAPVSLADVMDMFQFRIALEKTCFELIALHATDADLTMLDQFRTFTQENWPLGFAQYNRSFHGHLAALCGSARIKMHLIEVIDHMERGVRLSLADHKSQDTDALVREHGDLINALQNRDARMAQKHSEKHVRAAEKRVRSALTP